MARRLRRGAAAEHRIEDLPRDGLDPAQPPEGVEVVGLDVEQAGLDGDGTA